jgi:hypothetical protein
VAAQINVNSPHRRRISSLAIRDVVKRNKELKTEIRYQLIYPTAEDHIGHSVRPAASPTDLPVEVMITLLYLCLSNKNRFQFKCSVKARVEPLA